MAVRRSIVCAILATALAPASASAQDADAEANRLLVQAVGWAEAAADASEPQRLLLLGNARQALRQIVEDYSESDVAVRVALREDLGPLDGIDAAFAALLRPPVVIEAAVQAASEAAARIQDANERGFAFKRIAAAQAAAGDIAGANATAAGIEEVDRRYEALIGIAAAQAAAGDMTGALAIAAGDLDGALATALVVEEPVARAQAFIVIAETRATAASAQP